MNINSEPLFADPDNGDYTLQSSSPCIDAGDPESDLDSDGTIADMGAYFYDQSSNPSNTHSLSFDGSDDYVSVPSNSVYTVGVLTVLLRGLEVCAAPLTAAGKLPGSIFYRNFQYLVIPTLKNTS